MEPWELREWFDEFLQACNRHDPDALRSYLDPGMRRAHLPGGAEAWLRDYADLLAAFPDWQWRRIQLVIEDDRVAAHLRAGGTHLGGFLRVAPTRRRVNIAEFVFLRVQGGRITESTGSGPAEILVQLGAQP